MLRDLDIKVLTGTFAGRRFSGELVYRAVRSYWDNAHMSGDKLDINPELLAAACGQAQSTAAASMVTSITPPPPTVATEIDAALLTLAMTMAASRLACDKPDTDAANKQAAALASSPPALVEQDASNAQKYAPTVGAMAGKTWTT